MMERKTRSSDTAGDEPQRLQWGRSDDGAENRHGSSTGARVPSFNGAAPMMERKTPAEGSGRDAVRRFNGAAPMMERKTDERPRSGSSCRASMGPLR